jgi:hypothetical protein
VILVDATGEGSIDATGFESIAALTVGDTEGLMATGPFRSFVTFSLAQIPAGATVTEATLRLRQGAVFGTPYALGTVVAEHVTFALPGPAAADFASAAVSPGFDTVSTDAALVVRAVDVRARVLLDLAAGRPRSQFRLRFTPVEANGDAASDAAAFEDSANDLGTGDPPTLTVTFTP